jgi:AraC-like DNA-binding protein
MKSISNRIIATPSAYAREHYLYVQEVGTLKSLEPHISQRQDINSFLFFVVLDGSGFLSYDNSRFAIGSGDCVWLDCSRPYSHESSALEPWSLMWVHFYGSPARSYYEQFLSGGYSFIFHPSVILPYTSAIEQIYQLRETKSALMELCSHKYITDIITLSFTDNLSIGSEEYSIMQKLRQAHDYLLENFSEKIMLDDLSELFFISKFHLSREYKKAYGTTIGNALTAHRISHAKSMLRFSTASLDSIANDCGFQDAAYFIKVFKKAENMTPAEYRSKW